MMKNYNKILEAITRGIQIALDDYQDIETNNSISSYNDVINSEENIKHLMELNKITVDLDLPSGTRWCKYNLGADCDDYPESWYGDYFSWGETETKTKFGETTYTKFGYKPIKYNGIDKLSELQLEDDAAYQNMHFYNFKFRIPSIKQCEELLKYTTFSWTWHYQDINGLSGGIFTGQNGNELFFPAAGYYFGTNIQDPGGIAGIMTRNLAFVPMDKRYDLCTSLIIKEHSKFLSNSLYRNCGFNVRPVIL